MIVKNTPKSSTASMRASITPSTKVMICVAKEVEAVQVTPTLVRFSTSGRMLSVDPVQGIRPVAACDLEHHRGERLGRLGNGELKARARRLTSEMTDIGTTKSNESGYRRVQRQASVEL